MKPFERGNVMTKKTFVSGVVFVLAVGVSFLCWPDICVADVPGEVRIGATAPLTGPAAEAGVASKEGFILALEEWQKKGGVYLKEYNKKLPVKLFIEDCQSKPEVGVSLGEKLITREKVHFLISDSIHSSVTMAVMELAPKYGFPIMSVQPVSLEIAKKIAKDPQKYWSFWKGDWNSTAYANTIFSTYEWLLKTGDFKTKNKTIAFIVEDTDYGRSNAEKAGEAFAGIGWKPLSTETVSLGYTDFYPQLAKLKAMNPDILVSVFTSLSSGVALAKQFHEVGMKSSHMGVYYPVRPEYIHDAGKAADYIIWTPQMTDPINVPRHREFQAEVKKRWKVSMTQDHAYTYDILNNTLSTIEKAGSLEPKAVIKALSQLDRTGVLGRYVFKQEDHSIRDGEDFLPVPASQIQNGKNILIWPKSMAVGTYKTPPWMQ
jgi:branched-chain amino acid transport system substrate-binding protein